MKESQAAPMGILLVFALYFSCCAAQGYMMEYLANMRETCRPFIQNCAEETITTNYTLYEVFDIMVNNVTDIDDICRDNFVVGCTGVCVNEFRSSMYGHIWNLCIMERWIAWERHCWTETWATEARQCYRQLYPATRTTPESMIFGIYPVPFHVYDRATIERDCFPSAAQAGTGCPYYQSWLLQSLMPNYFHLVGYPQQFNHVNDAVGFPGITDTYL